MNIYELSRGFWDYAFENPDKVRPNHIAVYFFAIEHCNRLGWKEKFGLPTSMTMEAISIKSYNTYISAFRDLVDWGFFELVEKSKNQYSSNVIALSKNTKANDKALDKALLKHTTKHCRSTQQSTDQSNDSINIPITNLPINNNTNPDFSNLKQGKQLNPFPEPDSEQVQKATKVLADFFSISEINHPAHYMKIGNFCRHMEACGKFDYFRKQFTAYQEIKSDGQFLHSWRKYIGSPEEYYQDGAWNEKQWFENEKKKVVSSPRRNRNPQ